MKYPEIAFDPFFTWVNRPRILYAPGVRKEIGFEMSQLGGTRVVIFTDKGLVNAGVAEMVIAEVKNSVLELAGVFDGVLQDARIEVINAGAAFYRSVNADCLIAVGGGSVMDSAKAVNIMIGSGDADFQPLADQAGLWEGAKPLAPHIAFPTTAGTGCEVTSAMVVLDTQARAKLSVTHPYCNADLAMLDPELTLKLPPKITAFTGMDALTHAIESVLSTGAEPIADALSLHAIRLIFQYLPVAVHEPQNSEARGNMMLASTMAAMGFGNTMTGAVHALAHALGALYGIPHGLANAIMLPHTMAYNIIDERSGRFRMIADAMGVEAGQKDPREVAEAAVDAVKGLLAVIGLTETLKDFGVPTDREALQPLVELAAADGQIGYNPRYVEEADIAALYQQAH